MFHLPSCSKLLKKLSQLPIGLPAQSVRALCSRQVSIFLAFLIHRYKNPTSSPTVYLQNVYRERSISTILRNNRGLRTVYRHTASCGSLSCPRCLTSTQFPLPLPTPLPGPCAIEPALVITLVKFCEGVQWYLRHRKMHWLRGPGKTPYRDWAKRCITRTPKPPGGGGGTPL